MQTEYKRPSVSSFEDSDNDEEQDKFEEIQMKRIKNIKTKKQ